MGTVLLSGQMGQGRHPGEGDTFTEGGKGVSPVWSGEEHGVEGAACTVLRAGVPVVLTNARGSGRRLQSEPVENKRGGLGGSGCQVLESSGGLHMVEMGIQERVLGRAVMGSDRCFNNIPLVSKERTRLEARKLSGGYWND